MAAFENCLSFDPKNGRALLGLAVSLTNEGLDGRVIETLFNWISIKYPQSTGPSSTRGDLIRHFIALIQETHKGKAVYLKLSVSRGANYRWDRCRPANRTWDSLLYRSPV